MARNRRVKPVSLETYMKWVDRIVPPKAVLYVTTYEYEDRGAYDYDDNYRGPRRPQAERLDRDGILCCLSTQYENEGLELYGTKGYRPPTKFSDVIGLVYIAYGGESEWGTANVELPKDHKKRVKEQMRLECEDLAGQICRSYDVKMGTIEFVKALKKHYGRIIKSERHFRDDPEMRAERYATCVMGGAGRDAFYEDNDYAGEKMYEAREAASKLLKYMYTYCPLIMCDYEEAKKRRKRKKKR